MGNITADQAPAGCGTTHPSPLGLMTPPGFQHSKLHPDSPECCDTASKAFLKSRRTPSTFPSSTEWVSLPQMEIRLVNQDLSFTNACWLGLIVLYVPLWQCSMSSAPRPSLARRSGCQILLVALFVGGHHICYPPVNQDSYWIIPSGLTSSFTSSISTLQR